MSGNALRVAAVLLQTFTVAAAAQAEAIKVGVLRASGDAPAFIAQAKGLFAAEGLQSELVFFESAQPIAVATASGDVDFGVAGFTGGFYGLASQGVLRVIAGFAHEKPGFDYQPILASNKAWDSGLKSIKDFPGHSYGVSQIGAPSQYALGIIAVKYGFDVKSMRLLPLQTVGNIAAAVASGQADTAMMPGNAGAPLIARGQAKLLGWVGNEAPYQIGGVFVSAKTADTRGDTVRAFMRAFQKASRAYYDAFCASGKRADGPTAPEIAAIIAKAVNQPVADATRYLPYDDPDARLDFADVARQYAWYKDQGMVKGTVESSAMIDRRYAQDMK
jgi:NitT/TauT family transport system substrate-binding protein